MGCKLFVALQLEVAHHFIERYAGGSTRRFKPPAACGATKTPKMLLLNPFQSSVHGRPLRESGTVCGIHFECLLRNIREPPCRSVCDFHHISPLVEVSTEQRNRHCFCNIPISLNCAPTGYYGPEWFNEGAFTGAGPWFHGSDNFRGNVNNRLDPKKGYNGPTPTRGEKAEPSKRVDSAHFQGNEERDGRGNATGGKR